MTVQGNIATHLNLINRGIPINGGNGICPLYNVSMESVDHLLLYVISLGRFGLSVYNGGDVRGSALLPFLTLWWDGFPTLSKIWRKLVGRRSSLQ